ncbi:hypothetical protein SK571_35195 [Lentzea sp. BCCO 10_0798]|uniref:Uncharacterized protein n=1 Tax=Lentzea kristufekii TaxID=3095430 RepID=A0ABU4U300_9PSEU|nr:hypothetical protein [Lentzea sp. BCCO 10_0798]MDX8054644.1 hypothetical protein [Lentzea sp. BCCO 10_0798]
MQPGDRPLPFVGPVRRLAMPAEAQRAYLEAIGTAPSADELALEFDDVRPHLMRLDAEAAALTERIDALLDAMSGPSPVWHVDALAVAPQWASLRALAAELLRLLPFEGPRPLAPSERAVLERILAADFPGATALHAQLDHVRVLKPWYEGAPSLDLSTGGAAADVADGVLPVDAQVHESGELVGEILLWIADGRLSAIEYAWVTDEPPTRLPPVDQVTARLR